MKHAHRGFTLIEVMVAISLMAVVSIIAWRGLENVSSMQRRLSADTEDIEGIVRMLGQLERDVALRAPAVLFDTDTTPGGAAKTPLPTSVRVSIKETPDASATLEIIRSDAANPGAWQQIIWFLDGNVLRRAAGVSARQYPLPAAGRGAGILNATSRFTVRGWVPGQGWVSTPFPPTGTAFTGLELSVERRTVGGLESYRRVVVLE